MTWTQELSIGGGFLALLGTFTIAIDGDNPPVLIKPLYKNSDGSTYLFPDPDRNKIKDNIGFYKEIKFYEDNAPVIVRREPFAQALAIITSGVAFEKDKTNYVALGIGLYSLYSFFTEDLAFKKAINKGMQQWCYIVP